MCSVFCAAGAQKIGHFSYGAVISALPDYKEAQQQLDRQRSQYGEELKSAEQEFSEKYEMFIEQQATLDPTIRDKRQADLQDLLKRNMKFRNDAENLLKQTEQDLMSPIKARIKQAINSVGQQGKFLLIVNTDSDACPYLDGAATEDVTATILGLLR